MYAGLQIRRTLERGTAGLDERLATLLADESGLLAIPCCPGETLVERCTD